MNSSKTPGALAILLLAAAGPAAAAHDTGFYLGGSAGQSMATIDDARITSGLLGDGFTVTSIDDDDRDWGYKLFAGYRLHRYFALEAGYFDLGQFGFTATTAPPGTFSGTIALQGFNLDLVGIVPFTDRFSAFARAGVNYAEAEDVFSGTGAVNVPNPNRSQRAANYKFGGGLQYDFTENFGVRAEAERYRIDDAVGNQGDIDLASLGMVVRFGRHAPAAPVRATAPTPAPAPLAEARAPPAPPAPPPARALPAKVTFSADSLFDFDEAIVKPEGKRTLDALAEELRATRYETIRVTGHTDRVGSLAYNSALAAERAEAVKAYLMESAGIPAGKISARGLDESDPVTRPGQCEESRRSRASPELKACLQPDRRVEVEVTGTQQTGPEVPAAMNP